MGHKHVIDLRLLARVSASVASPGCPFSGHPSWATYRPPDVADERPCNSDLPVGVHHAGMTPGLQRIVVAGMAAVVVVAALWIWFHRPPPDAHPPEDVATCIQRGLGTQSSTASDSGLEIGAKVKEVQVNLGIKDARAQQVLANALADAQKAAVIDSCSKQYGAVPIFYPLVKVVDKASGRPLSDALVTNGSDFEKCTTVGTEGRCRMLVASRRAGARYEIDATLPGYRPASILIGADELHTGDALSILLEHDDSGVAFVLQRSGKAVPAVTVRPDVASTFVSDSCYTSQSSGPYCAQQETDSTGRAGFHFWPRPQRIKLLLVFNDGSPQVTQSVDVPDGSSIVTVPLGGAGGHVACNVNIANGVAQRLPKNGPISGAPPKSVLNILVADGTVTAVTASNPTVQQLVRGALVGQRVGTGSCSFDYPWTP